MSRPRKIFMVSLGCPKNLVDSENALGILKSMGYEPVSDLKEARTVVINTCGFIQEAVEESIETILEMTARKERGELDRVVVMGCFVQRYGYKLQREMPEVDAWVGTGAVHRIAEVMEERPGPSPFLISSPGFLADHRTPRTRTGRLHTAFVKIAEGCDRRCTFCRIPSLRGGLRSRNPASVVEEARMLEDQGTVELNLVAQDTTRYGSDLDRKVGLEALLEMLLRGTKVPWIRIHYAHPSGISSELLNLMETEPRICPYLDIPFQHVNPSLLGGMERSRLGDPGPWALLERIRALKRRIFIRTTLMVGFPGEGEKEFAELLDFVSNAELDYAGAFVFSPEKGTKAARKAASPGGSVLRKTAEKRLERLMQLQQEVSLKKKRTLVGQTLPVLVEGPSMETELLLSGRIQGMAPDIDGRVLINRGTAPGWGAIVPVRVTEAYPYDLVGEVIDIT
jgi:ribosomal protein S12 methylthiotransferase